MSVSISDLPKVLSLLRLPAETCKSFCCLIIKQHPDPGYGAAGIIFMNQSARIYSQGLGLIHMSQSPGSIPQESILTVVHDCLFLHLLNLGIHGKHRLKGLIVMQFTCNIVGGALHNLR